MTTILDDAVWNKAIPLLEDFSLVAQKFEQFKGEDPAAAELRQYFVRLIMLIAEETTF